jgi:hypothetical protein
MPFSKIFTGDLVYKIEYDEIDPNNLFDKVAMAELLEDLSVDETDLSHSSGSKDENVVSISKEGVIDYDESTTSVREEKRFKKRKRNGKNNMNKDVLDKLNKLANILTSGDLNALREFVDKHVASNCSLLTPTISEPVTGRDPVYQFFESLILLHPDLICEFHNFTSESDSTIYFTFNFDATYFDPENKSQFPHRDDDAKAPSAIDTSLWQNDHINGHKYEKNEAENTEKYSILMQQQKPIEVVIRGCKRVAYSIINNTVVINDMKLKWVIKKMDESSIEAP